MQDDHGFVCWWCSVCQTLTLLERAMQGQCAHEPRKHDCPTPPRMS